MTNATYEDETVARLKDLCSERDLKLPRNATKAELVELLEADDEAKVDPGDFGDLPPVKEAPDQPPEFQPPTAPPEAARQPAVKIPPDPPDPKDLPPPPEVCKLMNDVTIVANGLPTKLFAGAELLATEYDFEKIKSSGGVLVRKSVFDQSKLPRP